MSWVAAAVVGSAVAGGVAANSSAKKSAKAVGKAEARSIAEQRRQFDLVRSDTAGQRLIGNAALDQLAQLYGYGSLQTTTTPGTDPVTTRAGLNRGFEKITIPGTPESTTTTLEGGGSPNTAGFFQSPDYQFNLDQGQQAIDRSAAARGGLLSGSAVKSGQRFASGLASREFGSYVDRLMQQAGLGSTGIGASAAAGANAANNISAANINAGNARASAYQTGANGVNSAVQGGIGNLLLNRYLQPGAA